MFNFLFGGLIVDYFLFMKLTILRCGVMGKKQETDWRENKLSLKWGLEKILVSWSP